MHTAKESSLKKPRKQAPQQGQRVRGPRHLLLGDGERLRVRGVRAVRHHVEPPGREPEVGREGKDSDSQNCSSHHRRQSARRTHKRSQAVPDAVPRQDSCGAAVRPLPRGPPGDREARRGAVQVLPKRVAEHLPTASWVTSRRAVLSGHFPQGGSPPRGRVISRKATLSHSHFPKATSGLPQKPVCSIRRRVCRMSWQTRTDLPREQRGYSAVGSAWVS